MRLLFKQRFFSWFDSYDIYDENGYVLYTVKGELAWGHCFRVFDSNGREVGMLKEKVFSFLPRFEIHVGGALVGSIRREFTFFRPKFNIDFNGWQIEGDFFEWDYSVCDYSGRPVATVSKEIFNWTDTYVIDVLDPADALNALMLVLAIDAEKCSRD